ncbi:hypothetical protein J4443_01490 [Candidatus Woesearchaeota archaeon]|nr:hypothetical protein [Candidatus Woesearchaeota archaeon]
MNLLTKVLEIHGEKNRYVYDGGGGRYLYPSGTTRIVRKYFLFPRDINGTLVRWGHKIEQVASISTISSDDPLYHNEWRDNRIID